MKFGCQAAVLTVILAIGLVVFCNYYFAPPSSDVSTNEPTKHQTTSESKADESTLNDSKAVTIVAMYRYMGVTILLKTGGKGTMSGGAYGKRTSFNWVDTGKTIEWTNWNDPDVDGGKATCWKVDGDINVVWYEKGNRAFDRYYQVKVE